MTAARSTRGQAETDEIRRRLALSLDQESTRLRSARAELVTVRTELTTLAGGTFPPGMAPGEEASGVGTIARPAVHLRARLGPVRGVRLAACRRSRPVSVSMPAPDRPLRRRGLAPFVAAAAGGIAGGRRLPAYDDPAPPMGGMGAGAMGARAGHDVARHGQRSVRAARG